MKPWRREEFIHPRDFPAAPKAGLARAAGPGDAAKRQNGRRRRSAEVPTRFLCFRKRRRGAARRFRAAEIRSTIDSALQ
jgi:hypothetical protein